MAVTITVRTFGEVRILDCGGRITLGEESFIFRDKVREQMSQGNHKIILNLGDVSYIDHSGIGELISAFTSIEEAGGRLKLLRLTKRLKDLLQITKLYNVFEVYEEEEIAINSFQ